MTFANVRQRIGAFLLDYLIIVAYIVLLVILSVGLGFGPLRSVFRAMFADPNRSEISAFLLLVFPVILYFALLECSSWQATGGKRKMGLCVIDTHGARLSFPRSLVRSLLKFAPWELTHACLWRIPGWPLAPTAPFFSRAEKGEIATAGEIQAAFEAQLGARSGGKYHLSSAQSAWLAHTRSPSHPSQSQSRSTSSV